MIDLSQTELELIDDALHAYRNTQDERLAYFKDDEEDEYFAACDHDDQRVAELRTRLGLPDA
jgi:hypothetical protein